MRRHFLVLFVVGLAMAGRAPVASAGQNLLYHDGQVFVFPDLYITYWGAAWQNGFTTQGVPSAQFRAYLEGFFNSACNSDWLRTQQQYTSAGCVPNRVQGTWIDAANPSRQTPTSSDLYAEVKKSIQHFQGQYPGDANAITIIALAPGFGDASFVAKGGGNCGYHDMVDYRAFIVLPFQSDAPNACSQFAVNKKADGFGHGVFDGDSILASHELGETLTDPDIRGGWYLPVGNSLGENGDKCVGTAANLAVGGSYYAVQALWSNAAGGCVFGGSMVFDASPPSTDFFAVPRYDTSEPTTFSISNAGTFAGTLYWAGPFVSGGDAQDFRLTRNTCFGGMALPSGASCQVDVAFRPTALGVRQSQVVLSGFGPLGEIIKIAIPVRGTGVDRWAIVDPPVFSSGIFVGTSPAAPVGGKLTNASLETQYIASTRLGGPNAADFVIADDGCSGRNLQPSESCIVSVGFGPSRTGERDAELEFLDAAGRPFSVPLRGSGFGPVAELSSVEVSFGASFYDGGVVAGAPGGGEIPAAAAPRTVTVRNTGQAPLRVTGIEASGDFAVSGNDCVDALPPGQACGIEVRLRPTHFQRQAGTLRLYDTSDDSPHDVALTGVFLAPVPSLSPDFVRFGPTAVGTASAAQAVRLVNLESLAALDIQSIRATGDFTTRTDCPSSMLVGDCTILVTMTPTEAGPRAGMLEIVDNAPGSPHQIPLSGTGCAPGDLDCNGVIDTRDLLVLTSHLNQPAAACPACDLDLDGTITGRDVAALARLIGRR